MSGSRDAPATEPSYRTPPTQLKTSLSPTLAAVLKGSSPASSSARSLERKSPLPFSHPAPPRVPPSLQLHAFQSDSPKHSAGFVSSEPSSRSSSPQSPPSASPSPHSANPISVGRTLQAYSELAPPLHSAPKANSPSGLSAYTPAFSSRLGSVSARTPSSGPPASAQKAAYRPVKGPIQCQPAALGYYLYTQPSPALSVSSIQQRTQPAPPLPPAFPDSHPHPHPSAHPHPHPGQYHPAHHPHHPNPNAFQPLPLERTYSEDSEVLSQTDSDHAFAHSLSLSPHSLSPVIGDRPLRQSASAHSQVSLPTIVDVDCSPLSSPFTVNPSPPIHSSFNRIKSLSSAVPMRSSIDSSTAEAPAPTLRLRPGLAGGASSEGTQITSSAGSSSSGPSTSTFTTSAARAASVDSSGPSAGPSDPARPVLASPSHAAHVEPMHFAGRLLLIANRLPITFQKHSNGTWSHGPAAGGLVSAMKGVKAASMTWVGWPGTEIAESEQPTIVAKCKEINSFPVFLPKDMAELYYNGFSNHVLWPLFHYIHVNIEDTVDKLDKQWRAYIEANKLFCNAVLEVYEEGDIVWVHDYHLMLLPQFLRAARPTMKIGWFLHTPFPSSEIYRALPYREELLNGVLAADLLGFHIFDYGRHFKSACTRILGLEVTHQGVEHHGRFTQVGTFPIGIDAARFLAALEEEEVQREFADLQRKFKGMKVLLGIDRLDYIKGIPHKLLAVEKFLHHHPEWIGKVVLIQIAVPSRETVIEYQRLKSLTHELVGRVNGRFGTLESVPIHYLDQSVPFPKMCALYRLADLAIITSLRDGMNLVSYEYVVCQKGKAEAGVLILSEFAGAAQSLGAGSIRVNPWNTNQLAHAINQALQMPRDERNHLHQYAFGHITSYTAQRWAQQFIGELNNVCERVSTQLALVGNRWIAPRLVTEDVVSAFQQSRNRVVCLGVVGCLTQKRMRGVTVEQFGQMAQVPQETLDAIDRLSSDPNTTVLIMSALGRSVVDRLLGSTQAWLIPENGFFIRKGGRESQWEALGDNVDLSWIDEVEEVLNYFVQRTPRSFIEREESYLSWHYRDSDSEWAKLQVRDLLVHLMATPASSHGFEVVRGVKAIQIRPIGVSKGFAAQHCISEVQSARDNGVDFILCVGSFLFRDEDLFTSLLHYPAPGEKAELLEDAEAELGIGPEDPGLQLRSGAEVDDHEPGPSALGGSDGGESPSVNSITPTSLSHSPIAQHIITSSYLPPLALTSISDSPEPAVPLPKPAPVQSASGPSEAPSVSSSALRTEGESSADSAQEAGPPSEKSESVSSSSHPRQLGRSHSVFTFRGSQQQGGGSRKDLPTNALGTSFPSPRSYRAINATPIKDHPHNAKRHVFTCTVGRNKPSRAQFHVNGLHEVSNLLQRLAATIPSPAHTAHSAPSGSSALQTQGQAQAPALPSPEAPIHLAPTPSEAEAAGSQH